MLMRVWICGLAALLFATQQTRAQRDAWNAPVEPFRIIGNIYYIGAAGVSAFLIHTPEGSILLDGGLPETAPRIAQNIAKLGFDIRGVRFLLNSHAHYDHAGGLAELKRLTGGLMLASAGDAPALRAGGPDMPAVVVDRIIRDGETVAAGGAAMRAQVTPGHTQGCTTWMTTARESGRDYSVLFHCSTSVVAPLVGNTEYPAIVADYRKTFARFDGMKADVFLGAHPSFFDMAEKRTRMIAGGANPFVGPAELARFNQQSKKQFEDALAKQQR